MIKSKKTSDTTCIYKIEKEKTFSSNRKTIHCFFSMNDSFKNISRLNWEIHMDWENNV